MNERWKQKDKPASAEARFEFDNFDTLRTFLDEVAEHAESLDHHPNISFGKSHASLIIYAKDESLSEVDFDLVNRIDESFHRINENS